MYNIASLIKTKPDMARMLSLNEEGVDDLAQDLDWGGEGGGFKKKAE